MPRITPAPAAVVVPAAEAVEDRFKDPLGGAEPPGVGGWDQVHLGPHDTGGGGVLHEFPATRCRSSRDPMRSRADS